MIMVEHYDEELIAPTVQIPATCNTSRASMILLSELLFWGHAVTHKHIPNLR